MNSQTHEKYMQARYDILQVVNKVATLAQTISVAAKGSDSEHSIDLYSVGFLTEMIAIDIMEIEDIFERSL